MACKEYGLTVDSADTIFSFRWKGNKLEIQQKVEIN